jgi:DNA-directed RNA polymerase subunit RPC12/RpoP
MKLECQRCKKVWDYTGSNDYYATCPNCFTKVKVKKEDDKDV